MGDNGALVSREHYIELLVDASFQEASEMESGFMSWCQKHRSVWLEQGHDELWIRQRIESARATRNLHRTLKQQGLAMLETREVLRQMYAESPEFYDLAVERERLHPGPLQYRGNMHDLRQRYTLRVMIYETDKLAYEKFCRWGGRPIPGPDEVFFEQPDSTRVVRDLSTVEELKQALALCRYLIQLFDAPEKLTGDQIASLMEAQGQQLRASFIAKYGYSPENSAVPYIPVTIEGPQDHNQYYAREYP